MKPEELAELKQRITKLEQDMEGLTTWVTRYIEDTKELLQQYGISH